MITVWKYDLSITDWFELEIPSESQILTAQMQGNSARLWALVDTEQPQENRLFRLAGTGHDVFAGKPPGSMTVEYVGTFQAEGGRLVFHLFEAEFVPS